MSERLLDVACTKCPLHLSAFTVKVASRGSEKPRILFVGEAPGRVEDKAGQAFVGKSGKKLKELFGRTGIDEDWCRFTNVVRCLPPGQGGASVRPPYPEEVEACRDYLEAEIVSCDPIFIVPLGLSAIKFFCPNLKTVKGARGKRHVVEFPSITWSYKKYRKWLQIKGLDDEVKQVSSEGQMKAQLKKAIKSGFPNIPTKTYTVWPTFHPAAVLRGNAEAEQHMVEDFSYIRHQITGESSIPWQKYRILKTLDEIKEVYENIKQLYLTGQIKHIVSDVETTTLETHLCPFYELLCFCITWGEEQSVTIPFNHKDSPFFNDKLLLDAVRSLTNELFELVPVANHNLKFDVQAFWKAGIHVKKVSDDPMLAAWTLFNDTAEHGLEALTTRYTDMLSHKEEFSLAYNTLPNYMPLEEKYHRADGEIPKFCIEDDSGNLYRPKHYGDVDFDILCRYCAADGDGTFRLQVVLEKILREKGLWESHQALAIRATLPVAQMEWDGIRLDVDMFRKSQKEFERSLSQITQWFEDRGYLEEALEVVNTRLKKPAKSAKLTSTNVKRAIVYDILGFPVKKKTKNKDPLKRLPSTDKEAIEECLEQCLKHKGTAKDKQGFYSHRIEALTKILTFNKDNKTLTSYLKRLPEQVDENKIGHTHLGIRTTDTGRFNCKSPSWHIIPWHSIIKKAIVPLHENGLIMVSDFAQQELRVLAMVTQDEKLLAAFSSDRDLHRYVASLCYKKPEEDITDAERRDTKSVSFGIIFGRGAPAIAAQLNISIDEAQGLIDLWMTTFPKVKEWIDRQHELAHKNMEVWTCSGFHRIFPEGMYDVGEIERRAQNTPIQGPASDICDYAMIRAQEILSKVTQLQSKLWVTIHDSLCFSIYPSELLPIANLARKTMVDLTQRELPWVKIPLKNDYEVGVTWGELLKMELLQEFGKVELDGPTEYYDRFVECVMNWQKTPELLYEETRTKEGDDGSVVEYTKSTWNLAVN